MSTIPLAARMDALGLRLSPSEMEKFAVMVAEIEAAAEMVRGPRPYLEEPCHVLRLQPAGTAHA